MRLISADELTELYDGCDGLSVPIAVVRQNIEDALTVDAVEVVRCKDCKNMLVSDKGFRFCNVWCNINGMGDDGYCNYGERR